MTRQSPTQRSRTSRSDDATYNEVLRYVRSVGLLSRSQIAEDLGLPHSAVTHIVRRLMGEGYLVDAGKTKSSGGRPQSLLAFNYETQVVAVVDLRLGRIETNLCDWNGTTLRSHAQELGDDPVDGIEQSIAEAADGLDVAILAVCVAVPGVTSSRGRVRLASAIGLRDGQPIGEELRSRLGVPVLVDNDVNLMVMGEHVAGAGRTINDIALVHVGETGIGCGLMIAGVVRRGAKGMAGEIGFLPLGEPVPPTGGVGTFESRWCEEGISASATRLGIAGDGAPLERIQNAAGDNPAAAALLDEITTAWAGAVVSTLCVLDSELVLLGGVIQQLTPENYATVVGKISDFAPGASSVRPTLLGERALLQGAVRRAFDAYDAANFV